MRQVIMNQTPMVLKSDQFHWSNNIRTAPSCSFNACGLHIFGRLPDWRPVTYLTCLVRGKGFTGTLLTLREKPLNQTTKETRNEHKVNRSSIFSVTRKLTIKPLISSKLLHLFPFVKSVQHFEKFTCNTQNEKTEPSNLKSFAQKHTLSCQVSRPTKKISTWMAETRWGGFLFGEFVQIQLCCQVFKTLCTLSS